MKGAVIIAKEKLVTELKNGVKIILKKNKIYQKKNIRTAIFKLTTRDEIHYTYRKNVFTIEKLKKTMLNALNKNDNWPKKWFNTENKNNLTDKDFPLRFLKKLMKYYKYVFQLSIF